MQVFLTGATGFIGSHVARRLVREGHRVTALLRPGCDTRRIDDLLPSLQVLEGDLFASEGLGASLKEVAPELCIHMAWYAVPGKYLEAPENVECVSASMRLLQYLEAAGCPRVAVAGTCFEYDLELGYLRESTPARPRNLYSASKHGLSLMAEQFVKSRQLSLVWPRIFYQYGPWEDPRRLVPVVVRKLLAGEALPFAPGDEFRDYLHVEDVASAFCAAAFSPLEGPVNLGSSEPVTVAEIVRILARLLDAEDRVQLGALPPIPGNPPFICADTHRLRGETGWKPRYSLEEGLGQTVEWWSSSVRAD